MIYREPVTMQDVYHLRDEIRAARTQYGEHARIPLMKTFEPYPVDLGPVTHCEVVAITLQEAQRLTFIWEIRINENIRKDSTRFCPGLG